MISFIIVPRIEFLKYKEFIKKTSREIMNKIIAKFDLI
jgi:hypothetical protein